MEQGYKFETNNKILYLLPAPSMEGGMTITTHMFYEVGLFENPQIQHFNTSFSWSNNNLIRVFESLYIKLKYIHKLWVFKPAAIFVIVSPNWGYYDKIIYCLIAKLFGVKSYFNNVSGGFIDFYEKGKFNKWMIDLTIKIPDVMVLGSPFWMNYFNKLFPNIIAKEIANPVICKNFKRVEGLSFEDDKIRIVSAFRITKDKGVEELVEVIKGVCNKTDKIEFTVLGDGPEYKWMCQELSKYKLSGQVTLLGFVEGDDKVKAFINADAYLMLSHFDMMPIAILEAMSASLAIFSTRVGGIPDMVLEGENALLFGKHQTTEVIQALVQFIGKKNQLKEMGEISSRIVEERYNIDLIINQQLALMNS